jgi:hypothetical protein
MTRAERTGRPFFLSCIGSIRVPGLFSFYPRDDLPKSKARGKWGTDFTAQPG